MQDYTDPHDKAINDLVFTLAESKGKPPEPGVVRTYVEILRGFPLDHLRAAILALCLDANPFMPAAGQIVDAMLANLRGRGTAERGAILSNEAAWRLAVTTIASYQPQTRPRPRSGNPAVDTAIAEQGGVAELGPLIAAATRRAEDSRDLTPAERRELPRRDVVGRNVLRQRFIESYERLVRQPAHLRWVLDTGGAAPLTIPGLEIPDDQIAAAEAESRRLGRPLPAALEAVAARDPERAAVLDGQPPRPPYAQLPPGPPLTLAEREALAAQLGIDLGRTTDRMKLAPGGVITDAIAPAMAEVGGLFGQLRGIDQRLAQLAAEGKVPVTLDPFEDDAPQEGANDGTQ